MYYKWNPLGFFARYIQQAAASLTIFQNWYRLICPPPTTTTTTVLPRQCASAGLLLTHLNFCHREGRRGKLSNGLGSVQSEGVMTGTRIEVPFCTFLPLPGLFNHFTSTLSCLCSVLLKRSKAAAGTVFFLSLSPPRFVKSLFSGQSSQSRPPLFFFFPHKQMTG